MIDARQTVPSVAPWAARLHEFFCIALWGLAAFLALVSWTGFLGRLWWILDLTSHFRFQYMALSGLGCVVAVLLRRRVPLLILVVCLTVNLYLIYPFYDGRRTAALPLDTLRVMTINVNAQNRQFTSVLRTILDGDPDVVFVLEYTELWQTALEPLESRYAFTRKVPRGDNFGMAVYSRLSWEDAVVAPLEYPGFPTIELKIPFAGQTWTLLGTHVLPPVSGRASRIRNEQFAALAQYVQGISRPCAVLGDLNCTSWSPHLRDFLRQSELSDSRLGRGVQATWPEQFPWMKIPIDHCLVSRDILVGERSVTGDCGSDHRGIVVELAAAGRTGGL